MHIPQLRGSALLAFALALVAATPSANHAQAATPALPQQAISVNPFGLLFGLSNAEYERRLTGFSTAGVGGSFFTTDDEDYFNADAFYRFYPRGTPLEGLTLGVKAGLTSVEGNIYPGLGFDLNRSWLIGPQNFYVGVGFGLKRLYGVDDELLRYIPTLRLVNIGFAF